MPLLHDEVHAQDVIAVFNEVDCIIRRGFIYHNRTNMYELLLSRSLDDYFGNEELGDFDGIYELVEALMSVFMQVPADYYFVLVTNDPNALLTETKKIGDKQQVIYFESTLSPMGSRSRQLCVGFSEPSHVLNGVGHGCRVKRLNAVIAYDKILSKFNILDNRVV